MLKTMYRISLKLQLNTGWSVKFTSHVSINNPNSIGPRYKYVTVVFLVNKLQEKSGVESVNGAQTDVRSVHLIFCGRSFQKRVVASPALSKPRDHD